MPNLTRRRFLSSAAAASATATGLALLPPSLRKVLAATPPAQGSLDQVEHVIILLQENRSFDHYFGTLSGVRGFDDPNAIMLSTGRSVFYQPDSLNPDGYELPFHLDMTATSAAAVHDLSHSWGPQHSSWNGGAMDNWVPAHRASNGQFGPLCMGYYSRQDLPFHYALADAFTVCDNYHCSVLGPSTPNHLIYMSGTLDPDGDAGGPFINSAPPKGGCKWTAYAERLQAAGITWRSYQPGVAWLGWFSAFQQAPVSSELYQRGMLTQPVTAFPDDVRNGDVAQVTWLYSQSDNEHPPGHPAGGAQYMYSVLDALASRPDIWAKTVFFVTYDENDGFFDHVPPPTAPPGTSGEYLTIPSPPGGIAGPIGLGFRVPMLVMSPWSRGGWVSSEVFDHSSILRFLERRFGVVETNISAWRRSVTGDLTSALRFPQPNVPMPPLSDPSPQVALEKQEAMTLPAPTVPAVQTVPAQEPAGNALVDMTIGVNPQTIPVGTQATVTAVLSNAVRTPGPNVAASGSGSDVLQLRPVSPQALTNVQLTFHAPAGWSVQATSSTSFPTLAPGSSVQATWQLTAGTAAAAALLPTIQATYQIERALAGIEDPLPVTVQ